MSKAKETLKKEREHRIVDIRKELKEARFMLKNTNKELKSSNLIVEDLKESNLLISKEKDTLHSILLDAGLLTPKIPKILDSHGDSSVALLPWKERRKLLHGMKFTSQIKEVPSILSLSDSDTLKAIRIVSKLPRSEGAMIKDQNAKYPIGKGTDAWVKFKNLQSITVKVLAVNKAGSARNYTVGIPALGPNIKEAFVVDGILRLGNTFNTSDVFSEGDKIEILVEEVWRHKWPDGKKRYSIHKPRVVGESSKTLTTIKSMDDLVVSRGIEVDEGKKDKEMAVGDTTTATPGIASIQGRTIGRPALPVGHYITKEEWERYVNLEDEPIHTVYAMLKGEGEEGSPAEPGFRRFPDERVKAYKSVADGKWRSYVMQIHLRGKSMHNDIRHLVPTPSPHLESFTLFTRSVSAPINIRTTRNNIRGTYKVPQPKIWLKVHGVQEVGLPGSTKEFPGIFVIVSRGNYRVLEATDTKIVIEYKSTIGKINKKPLNWAKNQDFPFWNPGDDLIQLDGCYSYHIAHIEKAPDRWIMLWDKLKKCPEEKDAETK